MQRENPDGNPYNNGFEYGVRHLLSPKSGSVSELILSSLNNNELTSEKIAELFRLGSIYVSGKRAILDHEVPEATYIRVHMKPRRFPENHGQWQDRILFENEDFLVVNKPAGLPVHASVDNSVENLQRYLSDFCRHELFVTHRLDLPTRGLLVFAKTKSFLSEFNRLLAFRGVQKIYQARTEGVSLQPGLYQHYMEPSPRAPKTVSEIPNPLWQECRLQILSVKSLDIAHSPSLHSASQELKIELLTGRTHQIRAQLAALKAPILGDTLYGARKLYEGDEIDLTATTLKFLNYEFQLSSSL